MGAETLMMVLEMRLVLAWLALTVVGVAVAIGVLEHRFPSESIATIAEVLAASATVGLAFITMQSVAATQAILANERETHDLDVTIDLMFRFTENAIPVTNEITITPHAAATQLQLRPR